MFKKKSKDQPVDDNLDQYMKTDQEVFEEANADIERATTKVDDQLVTPVEDEASSKKWTKKKKLIVGGAVAAGLLLIFLLTSFFILRPSRTNKFVKDSWHNMIVDSSSIERATQNEVNLEGTRQLADNLYSYNQKLGSLSYSSKAKSSWSYQTGKTKELVSLTESMSSYFNSAAKTLAKSNSDISSIEDSELDALQTEGENLQKSVEEFQSKFKLSESFNPSIFKIDDYIVKVKENVTKIEQEKKEEEQRIKQEKLAKEAKDQKDKADVTSVSNSYFTAFVNGNEAGVRATLSEGYKNEYNFNSLSSEQRLSFFPKGYRIVAVDQEGSNYKVTATVTYTVVSYTEEDGRVETSQTTNQMYRVVYSSTLGAWKIDGEVYN